MKSNLLSKISSTESMVSFQNEVVEFWELFIQASSLGTEHVQCLERLVRWAKDARKVKVVRGNSYLIQEMTFAAAWEEVTFKHGLILQQE